MAARVSSIFIYPIKSCRGISLLRAPITATGFRWDRQWVVVNAKGRACTQRVEPRLALVVVELPSEAFIEGWEPTESSYMVLKAPGMNVLKVSLSKPHGTADGVSVWEWSGSVIVLRKPIHGCCATQNFSIPRSVISCSLIMYSTVPDGYEKYSDPPPSYSKDTASGVPVSSDGSLYYESSKPAAFQIQSKTRLPWSSGLFGCFSDLKTCLVTCFCPCITFGQVAEIVDKGSTSCGASGALYALVCCVIGCPCFYSCFYRAKMRQQYLLRQTPCCDCLVHCFCECCALCQEHRELKTRGFDMTIGWHGNVEQRNRAVAAMAPAEVEGSMSR